MRVNVIGKSNGVGLSRDLSLMADALRACGCEVVVTAVDGPASHRRRSRLAQLQSIVKAWWRGRKAGYDRRNTDINIMMEHVWTDWMPDARLNVIVPNPEWFDRHDVRMLRHVDRVWAKTGNTQNIFTRLRGSATCVGFDSEDRYDAGVKRARSFFHLAGKSSMKGTERLLSVWRQQPHWPTLLVVQHEDPPQSWQAENIEFRTGYLHDDELRRLQNASLFHVCTSESEGWGHYLVEAMSVGAVTITVDAPPMNEFITPDRGILVPYLRTRMQKQATCYLFDEVALVSVIEQALAMSDSDAEAKGAAGRGWFLENKRNFNARVMRALQEA